MAIKNGAGVAMLEVKSILSIARSGTRLVQVVMNNRMDRPACLLTAFSPVHTTVKRSGAAGSPGIKCQLRTSRP